jgi:hypothetical protein
MSGTFDTDLQRGIRTANVSQVTAQVVLAQHAKLAAIEPPANAGADTRRAIQRAVDEAFVSGFRRVMLIATALALASAIGAWVMIGLR